MIGLDEKTLAELESLAQSLRELSPFDPQHKASDIKDVEWEIEKRKWRQGAL